MTRTLDNVPGDRKAVRHATPGVFHEARDPRLDIRIALPFQLFVAGYRMEGEWFSLSRIRVRRIGVEAKSGKRVRFASDAYSQADYAANMRIRFNGFTVGLPLRVSQERRSTEKEDVLDLRIVDMDVPTRETMKRVARYHLTGRMPSPDDLIRDGDAETPAKPASAAKGGRRKLQIAALCASVMLCLAVILISLASIHNRLFVVHSEFASVTAPKIDMLSPANGRVSIEAGDVGGEVVRDDVLFNIASNELDAAIGLAEARITYLQNLADLSRSEATSARSSGLFPSQAVVPGQPQNADSGVRFAQFGNALAGREGGDEAYAAAANGEAAGLNGTTSSILNELHLERSRLRALKLRKSALTEFSACHCTVAWSQENGTWVKEGDRIMVLTPVDPRNLKIEALVRSDSSRGLFVGQKAHVFHPGTGERVEAEIERITLDNAQQPRFGFPNWLRQDVKLVSVFLKSDVPVSRDWIGAPLEVSITRPLSFGRQ